MSSYLFSFILTVTLCVKSPVLAFQCSSSSTSLRALTSSSNSSQHSLHLLQMIRTPKDNQYYDEEEYNTEGYEDDGYDDFMEYQERRRSRMPRREPPARNTSDGLTDAASPFGTPPKGMRLPDSVSQALLAGVFVLGIGTGVTVDSQINTSPKDLASRDAIDQAAPNPRVCSTYGASAMAFDQRVFVSFNPFNVYVAQADVKPACVLRPSNVVPVLQDKGLINEKEVRACKQNMNTWAFVGDLNDYPQISCVYKSEDAQNEFLSNPKYGIGEDVYDDDREAIKATSSRMKIKDSLTEGERDSAAKAAKLKREILSSDAALGKDPISNI